MEEIQGQSNWRLLCAKHPTHVEILQAVTCDTTATLPHTLWGLPVTTLGNHALRQGWVQNAEASALTITWGAPGPEAKWDNRNLQSLTLPQHLAHVGDYALCNCQSLHTLTLWDDVAVWGSCALMNCRHLERIFLQRTHVEQGISLAYFADELSRHLDVSLTDHLGQTARLIFPEYEEHYEENHRSLKFSYSIVGTGYQYHQVFRQKKLSMRDYDALFIPYLKKGYDPHCAMLISFHRLQWPYQLSEESALRYWTYLERCPGLALNWLVEQKDGKGLSLVLPRLGHDQTALAQASALSRTQGFSQGTALLLEYIHRNQPPKPSFSFEL